MIAEAQTEGRGRAGCTGRSRPGSSIALSVLLRLPDLSGETGWSWRVRAVAQALEGFGLLPRIKWPNDVLLGGRKVAGVLPEAEFSGNQSSFVVLGIGVNAGSGSAPPDLSVDFPATSVEAAAGRWIDRADLIVRILGELGPWIGKLETASFLSAWERRLAFVGERVRVESGGRSLVGVLLGLAPDGAAKLRRMDGQEVTGGGGGQPAATG